MSELSPVDKSVVDLLESSRRAREQDITDRARAAHDACLEADKALEVSGLLLQECQSLQYALIEREKYYLDANWIQKRRLKKLGHSALPIKMTVNGRETAPSDNQARIIRKYNILKHKRFTVKGLSPTEPELTDAGPIQQDWMVTTEPFFIRTYLRTMNTDHEELVETSPMHRISMLGNGATVYEDGSPLSDDDYYLPLGLVIEAGQKVKESVPRRVSKKWQQGRT